MVATVVLESVGCVVALGALSTPCAAGAAHAAGTPDAVSVPSCKQNKTELMVSRKGEKDCQSQDSISIKRISVRL